MSYPSITITIRNLDPNLRDELEAALAYLDADIDIIEMNSDVPPAAEPTASWPLQLAARSRALIARGWYHLRHSGFRRTARMGADYLCDRTGLGTLHGRHSVQVTHEDLLAAMVVLQRDMRDLRAQLASPDAPTSTGVDESR